MSVKVSIACLIYKSTRWLQFVYDQVRKYTDLSDKEFYFVANDANENVLNYLKDNRIPHYIHNNTEEQKNQWYINNVYRAWNTAIQVAKGEFIVLINSDMAFTYNWLESLIKNYDDSKILTSRLVERGILSSGTYGIEQNFGNVPEDYRDNEFVEYAKHIATDKRMPSGLFMPLLIKKKYLEMINYYPEGNITPESDLLNPTYAKIGEPCVPGDHVLIKKLNRLGIEHFTDFNSIVYHFQEGEMRDTIS
jgi:hypothetical protein